MSKALLVSSSARACVDLRKGTQIRAVTGPKATGLLFAVADHCVSFTLGPKWKDCQS